MFYFFENHVDFSQKVPWYIFIMFCISVIAIFLSMIAISVAIRNYRRKSGAEVIGGFGFGSSIQGTDRYIHKVSIQNMKDRSITIFGIYIRLGRNILIELENREYDPLILKPFESYQKNYQPILLYGINGSRIFLNKIIDDDEVSKKLVLSTNQGRVEVSRYKKLWHPVGDSLGNPYVGVVQTIRASYKGRDIGDNIKYIVEFMYKDGSEHISLYDGSEYRTYFKNFKITKDSLESVQQLQWFFDREISLGNLDNIEKIKVIDAKKVTEDRVDFFKGDPIKIHDTANWFEVNILGKIRARRKIHKRQN